MRSDALINVTCDICQQETIEIYLTALARGGYDERNVDAELKRMGWSIIYGKDICDECQIVE